MGHGKTEELELLTAQLEWDQFERNMTPRETRARDRSLNGKARVKARKAAQRANRK